MNTADCHAGNGMLQAELEHPNHSMSQPYSYHCCTVSALMLRGRMRNTGVEMMLNSVACISLVREDTATRLSGLHSVSVHIVSAMGELVLGHVFLPVQVGPMITLVE